jgi:DNA primase
MILQIVQSIAVIPDIIKRQVYIKDTASLLTIPEDILIRKVNEIRKNTFIERKKKKDNESTQSLTTENSPTNLSTTIPIDTTKPHTLTHKERNILNLLQVLIRYGEKIIYQADNGYTICAGEYIIQEIRHDSVDIANPIHQRIMDEFISNYRIEGFISSVFFQHHPEVAISQLAVDLIADKYQLSRIYSRQSISENVVHEIQSDDKEELPELVQRLLFELKYTIVNERLDAVHNMLQEAHSRGDWEMQITFLEQKQMLELIRAKLSKVLGNRVIV